MEKMKLDEMKDLCALEDSLISCAKAATQDMANVNAKEMGEVVDAIKDLAEAKKNCYEAKYYCSVVEAMEQAEKRPEMYERMGYPMGYEPMYDRMGYNPNRYPSSGRYASAGHGERMGYENPEYTGAGDKKYGYTDGGNGGNMGYMPSRYGVNYEQYRNVRRHYTNTNDQADLQKMSDKAREHLDSVSESLRDMWNDANQQTRDQIRETLNRLTAELN